MVLRTMLDLLQKHADLFFIFVIKYSTEGEEENTFTYIYSYSKCFSDEYFVDLFLNDLF